MNANLAKPHGKATPRPRLRGFTLVEMMVVIVIAAIVMAIAIPSFVKMTSGSAVRSGTRLVAAQLRLTRQHAISQRRTIALIMPGEIKATSTGNNLLPDELSYVAMKPAYVTGSSSPFTFAGWVEGAKWLHVPRGAVIAEADTDKGIADGASFNVTEPTPNGECLVEKVTLNDLSDLDGSLSGATEVLGIRALVFSPTGRVLDMTESHTTIAQITYTKDAWIVRSPGDSGTATKLAANQFNIEINIFTGRIKIETPDQY